MTKMVDARAVEAVLFGVHTALHGIAGASAPAVMRKAAPDLLEALESFGVTAGEVDSLEKLEERLATTMVNAGCCDSEKSLNKRARLTHLAPTEGGDVGDTTLRVELHDR